MKIHIREIDHVVIRVADLDSLTRFYCDVLGCSLEKEQRDIGLIQLRAGRSLIDLLTFSGFFQTIRLFGGEIGATFMQFFLQRREQFHSNILGLHVQAGSTEANQRLLRLTAGMRAKAASPRSICTRSQSPRFCSSSRTGWPVAVCCTR